MSDQFHQKLTQLSTDWAEAERNAAQAELDLKQIFAKKFLIFKTNAGVEVARQMVEGDREHFEAAKAAIEARYSANLSKRAIKDAETSFERWRTIQANDRFTARTAT